MADTKLETPATPPAPPVQDPVPQPTAEELDAQIAEFKSTFYGGDDLRTRQIRSKKKEPVVEPPPDPEPPPPEPPKPPVTQEAPPVQPEPKKPVVVPPPPTEPEDDDSEEKLAARVAERLKPVLPAVTPTLTNRELKMIEVFKEMAELDPEYKDLDKRFIAQKKREEDYIAKWEQENPGQRFDDQDTEHDEFYKKTAVDYDNADFAIAVDSLAVKKSQELSERLIEKKLRERDLQNRAQTERQAIHGVVNEAIHDLIERAVPEFKDIITVNGKRVLDKDTDAKMDELDPVARTILQEECEQMSAVVRELEEATRLGEAYKADPAKTIRLTNKGVRFAPFAEMLDAVNNLETEMLKLPPEQTARDGKRLISVQDFADYQRKIANDPKRQAQFSRDYYCLGADDFRAGIVAQAVATAKSRIERHKMLATKKQGPAPQVGQKPNEPPPPPPAPPLRRNGSTVIPSSDTVNTRKTVNEDEEDPVKLLQAVRLSR